MPILDPHSLEFISHSVEQTRRVGMRLGALVQTGDFIGLAGDLGSGKTTFVQGLAAGWGSADRVSSPSFVIVNLYRRSDKRRLYHLDAYRLNSVIEADDIDLDTLQEQGALVIEWADRLKSLLPVEYLWVTMRYVDIEQRDLIFSARGARYQALLAVLRRRVYGVI